MRQRVIAIAVTAIVSLPTVVTTDALVSARVRVGPCDLRRWANETVEHHSKRLIACAIEEFGPVRGGKPRAVCIAKRESGLIPTAQSPSGAYVGLYQHSSADWPRRYRRWTEPDWALPDSALQGRTNSIVAIRMVAEAGGWKRAGWPVFDC